MSGQPAISVVTPTRNRVGLLARTLDSVAAQTLSNWEHIVVDDGSEDGTAEAMAARSAADPRVRYLQRQGEVQGANVCRNQGIAAARADLVVMLDSDDLLRPGCLAGRRQVMERNLDLDLAVFSAGVFDKEPGDLGRIFHDDLSGDHLYRFLAHDTPWQTTGPVWRLEFLRRIGGFDERLLSMQDLEIHVRALAMQARYLWFAEIDHDIRWEYDALRTSVRHYKDAQFAARVELTRETLDKTVRNCGLMSWSRSRALAGMAFGAAESLVRMGLLSNALAVWSRGCRAQKNPEHLRIMGAVMLVALSLKAERLVNKWKGWVRFRQEPRLMGPKN